MSKIKQIKTCPFVAMDHGGSKLLLFKCPALPIYSRATMKHRTIEKYNVCDLTLSSVTVPP